MLHVSEFYIRFFFIIFFTMKFFALPLLCMFAACVYEPEQFEASEHTQENISATTMGALFAVNGGKQICNPSVSQDTVNYPASMLWLNFGGKLNVHAPDSIYTVSKVIQHDRLTVSDTAGNVKWYFFTDESKGDCQFQDPEWSTHPNFVVALRGYDIKNSSACENLDYGIFAVRMSDKKPFYFYEKDIGEFATPHLWINDSDNSIGDSLLTNFFGTDNVRLVYVDKNNNIIYANFKGTNLKDGIKKAKKLKKPANVEGWILDSPLISPDGNFIVYNAINSSMNGWKSYVQELSENSLPIEIEQVEGMISTPVQPHWFKFGEKLFIEWAEFPQGSQYLNKNDFFDVSVQNGSAGRTAMREVNLQAGAPSDLLFSFLGNVTELAPVPMIGGRSPDGHFISTGANNGYLLQLP